MQFRATFREADLHEHRISPALGPFTAKHTALLKDHHTVGVLSADPSFNTAFPNLHRQPYVGVQWTTIRLVTNILNAEVEREFCLDLCPEEGLIG